MSSYVKYAKANDNHTSRIGIEATNRYSIAKKVAVDEEVSFTELSKHCKLPNDNLVPFSLLKFLRASQRLCHHRLKEEITRQLAVIDSLNFDWRLDRQDVTVDAHSLSAHNHPKVNLISFNYYNICGTNYLTILY